MVEAVVIGLRALSLAAALHAAGVALFVAIFGHQLHHSKPFVHRLLFRSALMALGAVIAYQVAEPARLLGRFDGVFDVPLQVELLASSLGTAASVRAVGLTAIVLGCSRATAFGTTLTLIGVTLVACSFTYSGHTSVTPLRWLLAPTLFVHTIVVAFWFGALWPLAAAVRREETAVGARLIDAFSQVAVWLVPAIFVAGLGLSAALLPALSSLNAPYGRLLVAKATGFTVLLALASINKWQLAPVIRTGSVRAAVAFRGAVFVEWFLIVLVIAATAVMTGLFSP